MQGSANSAASALLRSRGDQEGGLAQGLIGGYAGSRMRIIGTLAVKPDCVPFAKAEGLNLCVTDSGCQNTQIQARAQKAPMCARHSQMQQRTGLVRISHVCAPSC
mmetsp:Transcript_73175/g.128956  ORF Transcript_73175/g.128956 Transcript_73175/m.128956 type:complete len:105 (+) Transcript_73175:727-1041(+)